VKELNLRMRSRLVWAVAVVLLSVCLGQLRYTRRFVAYMYMPAWYVMDKSPLHSLQSDWMRAVIVIAIIIGYLWLSISLVGIAIGYIRHRVKAGR